MIRGVIVFCSGAILAVTLARLGARPPFWMIACACLGVLMGLLNNVMTR